MLANLQAEASHRFGCSGSEFRNEPATKSQPSARRKGPLAQDPPPPAAAYRGPDGPKMRDNLASIITKPRVGRRNRE